MRTSKGEGYGGIKPQEYNKQKIDFVKAFNNENCRAHSQYRTKIIIKQGAVESALISDECASQ